MDFPVEEIACKGTIVCFCGFLVSRVLRGHSSAQSVSHSVGRSVTRSVSPILPRGFTRLGNIEKRLSRARKSVVIILVMMHLMSSSFVSYGVYNVYFFFYF